MFKAIPTFAVVASVWAATLTLPAQARAKEGVAPIATTTSPDTEARALVAAPTVKRTRRGQRRRFASVLPQAAKYPQCFLFWCTYRGRVFNPLVLGVAY